MLKDVLGWKEESRIVVKESLDESCKLSVTDVVYADHMHVNFCLPINPTRTIGLRCMS